MRVRSCEAVRECLQENDDLVLLLIRQMEITERHVDVRRDLGRRPAIYFLRSSYRAASHLDGEREHIACVIEMHELLQALDIAVVEKLLLEVRPWRFGRGTLWRYHGHVPRSRHLHLTGGSGRELGPAYLGLVGGRARADIRVGAGAATEEESQPQIDKTEVQGIGSEPEEIRRGLIVKSDH